MVDTTSATELDPERWLARLAWAAIALPMVFIVALPLAAEPLLRGYPPHVVHLCAAVLGAVCVAVFGLVMLLLVRQGYLRMTELQHRALEAERRAAVLQERERLAREMHDSLAQSLAAVRLRLLGLQASPGLAGSPEARTEAGELAGLCQESVRDIREAITGLRQPQQGSMTEAVASHLEQWSRSCGIEAHLQCCPESFSLPAQQEVQLSRVVQEALANVRKHSGAHRVDVTMAHQDDGTRVVVGDDGRGFDPRRGSPEGHFGLQTMRERIAALGGTLTVLSEPGCGTRLVVELPADGVHPTPSRQPLADRVPLAAGALRRRP